jgi:uncharacterized membrane-anchored protein
MQLSPKQKFYLAVAVQAAIILLVIAVRLPAMFWGQEVMLRIEPVDPKDPLRGDYVILNYSISQIQAYDIDAGSIQQGDTIYVILEKGPNSGYYNAESAVKQKPGPSELFIKGTVNRVRTKGYSGIYNSKTSHSLSEVQEVNVKYGIEEYFISEGSGRGFSFWEKEAAAKVKIDNSGNPVITQVYVDGQPWP